jgi:hypothetical protein
LVPPQYGGNNLYLSSIKIISVTKRPVSPKHLVILPGCAGGFFGRGGERGVDDEKGWMSGMNAWTEPCAKKNQRHVQAMSYQFHIKALSSLARLRLLNVLSCTPRSLNPRRLDIILDLELESDRLNAIFFRNRSR